MPAAQHIVDSTFDAWWKQYGRTQESIPKALQRTQQQIGGAMPPGYLPPPMRLNLRVPDAPTKLFGEFPRAVSPQPQATQKSENKDFHLGPMTDSEILEFLTQGKQGRMEGMFLPNAMDAEDEERVHQALSNLKRRSKVGENRLKQDLREFMTEEQLMWMHPELVKKLNRLPCLVDRQKQAERDYEIFRKFWNLGGPIADIDPNFMERLRQQRMTRYLQDWRYLQTNPIAAGAYGVQRFAKDKGHEHGMRVAIAAQSAFNLGSRYNTSKQPAPQFDSKRTMSGPPIEELKGIAPNGGTPQRPINTMPHDYYEREALPPVERSW